MSNTSEPIRVLITGGAGQIANSMIPLVLNGEIFGRDQMVSLNLLEIPPCLKKLQGIGMEIEDGAYRLLDDLVITDKEEVAFKDIDVAIFIGGFSIRGDWKNFERDSLLKGNVPIFAKSGKSLDTYAKKTVKVVVVANPANTNAYILSKYAPSIPKENITALTRLDFNRGISLIARNLKKHPAQIKNFSVWGNHNRTMVSSTAQVHCEGKETALSDDFKNGELKEFIKRRFKDIVDMKGATSSLSAANAVKDHLHDWHFGTKSGEHVGMGVFAHNNPYGFEEDVISSYPVEIKDGKWKIVEGFEFDDAMKKDLDETMKNLAEERDNALKFCE